MADSPIHFVLDQNFPWQAAGLEWPPTIRVTPLFQYDPELTRDHQDWEVLAELHVRGDVNGFITNDGSMLAQVKEMVTLRRTQLTLVVSGQVGHLSIIATGLVMVYLGQIAKNVSRRPQIYSLNL